MSKTRQAETPPLLTAAQAAVVLGRSVKQVHRYAEAGELPTAFKAPGVTGARLFNAADVEAFAARTVGTGRLRQAS